jgi:hypothetical protein
VTPEQAIKLLSVRDWPPKLEHWPPKHKDQWRPGMSLVGRIETVMTLPRPEGSKKRGEPYTALYVRREPDHKLVMWHGWHTAAEDVDGMHPAPGLLFAAYYRGEETSGFENFKYIVAPFDDPQSSAQQTRQAGGRSTEAPSRSAPEGGERASSSSSGSNPGPDLRRVTTVAKAQEYVLAQTPEWQATFKRLAAEAADTGEAKSWSKLAGYHTLISRTHAARAKNEAA